MALDPTKYDVNAFEKARAAFNANAKKGKIGTFNVNDYLLPGQASSTIGGSYSGVKDPRFGAIPNVPNPTVTQAGAISGNLANFGDLSTLTGKTNDLLAGQYTGRLPGYSDLAQTNSANIGAQLRGELPQDVINLIGQQSAERGIAGGIGGSQFSNAEYLKALGLTSLGEKEKGGAAYDRALGRIKDIPTFDPSSMFTSPTDMYNAQLTANTFAASPDPTAAGRASETLGLLPGIQQQNREASLAWDRNRELDELRRLSQMGSLVGR